MKGRTPRPKHPDPDGPLRLAAEGLLATLTNRTTIATPIDFAGLGPSSMR
ncbi:hypothetical protein [Mesobaculum littorinae]|nr:hypothetical protein [Mesobaculum littorinae]